MMLLGIVYGIRKDEDMYGGESLESGLLERDLEFEESEDENDEFEESEDEDDEFEESEDEDDYYLNAGFYHSRCAQEGGICYCRGRVFYGKRFTAGRPGHGSTLGFTEMTSMPHRTKDIRRRRHRGG